MALIELHGWGSTFRIVKLTKKLLNEVTMKGVDANRLDEIFYERQSTEVSLGGFYNKFDLMIGGQQFPQEQLEDCPAVKFAPTIIPLGKIYLIREELQKGHWLRTKTKKAFNPHRLEYHLDTLKLPDGRRCNLLNVTYEGQDAFGETTTTATEEYVLGADGSRTDVRLIE
jgi:hypothetical protein